LSAPASSRSFTIVVLPMAAAQIRAVWPSYHE